MAGDSGTAMAALKRLWRIPAGILAAAAAGGGGLALRQSGAGFRAWAACASLGLALFAAVTAGTFVLSVRAARRGDWDGFFAALLLYAAGTALVALALGAALPSLS